MEENRISIGLGSSEAFGQGQDIEIEKKFEVPIENRMGGFAITGIVLNVIGLLAAIALAIVFIIGYPETWFNFAGQEDSSKFQQGIEDLQRMKETVVSLALISAAFMFTGLAMYTYGRTIRGDQDE